jgi:hypothetical protein
MSLVERVLSTLAFIPWCLAYFAARSRRKQAEKERDALVFEVAALRMKLREARGIDESVRRRFVN